jgi:DNA-binding NarL/FixJ family response regulator
MSSKHNNICRILLVDRYPLLRLGLTNLINSSNATETCGFADNPDTALSGISTLKPDIIILDASLQADDILEIINLSKKLRRHIPIMLISMPCNHRQAKRMLSAGALAYLTKDEPTSTIINIIKSTLTGKNYVSKNAIQKNPQNSLNDKSGVETLSDRELEIFELIGRGRTTREIAAGLQLSIKTVETHRSHIKQKLRIKTATELAHRAFHWSESAPDFD